MNNTPIITKASGKILMSGGYGVLEQNNYGLSLAVQNSFYCICTKSTISTLQNNNNNSQKNKKEYKNLTAIVESPQINQKWEYCINGNIIVEKDKKQNKFVQNAIICTVKYYLTQNIFGQIHLILLFDRDFISDDSVVDQHSQKYKFGEYKAGYNKTGLGSSACVTVSIVKCLITLFDPSIPSQKYLKLVNVISQIANLSAQKKIGSNFDISTAVYGSHLYKNILPHQIAKLGLQIKDSMINQLLLIDPEIKSIDAPKIQLYSYIIDINKGADTRQMVKSFTSQLKKCSKQLQQQFFRRNKHISQNIYNVFIKLSKFDENYKDCIAQFKHFNKVHRALQQKYSKLTGVPIQPEDLTKMIDKIVSKIHDILYIICPGSGGYDAVFVLACKDIQKQLNYLIQQKGQQNQQLISGKIREISINFNKLQITHLQIQQIKQYLCQKSLMQKSSKSLSAFLQKQI